MWFLYYLFNSGSQLALLTICDQHLRFSLTLKFPRSDYQFSLMAATDFPVNYLQEFGV